MGRSAKFHKRAKKNTSATSSTHASKPSTAAPIKASVAPIEQKKHAGLKAKAATKRRKDSDGPVLGGADYVQLLMGSRRKAREEAAKMPVDSD